MTFPRCLGTIVKGKGLLQACRSEYCRRGAPLTAPRAACQTRRPFRAEPGSASASGPSFHANRRCPMSKSQTALAFSSAAA